MLAMWSLPNFVTVFIVLAVMLMTVKELRRRVLVLVVIVAVATLVFYAPVLPALVSNASQKFGRQLALPGFITVPLHDLLGPNVTLLLPDLSPTGASIVAACILLAGCVALVWRSERFLMLVLLLPAVGSYLILEIARTYVADRFESFLVLPLLLLGSVGLVEVGRRIARTGRAQSAGAAVVGAALMLFALDHDIKLGQRLQGIPFENYRDAAAVANGSGIAPIVMLGPAAHYPEIEYYFGNGVKSETAQQLEARFCAPAAGFVYVELRHGVLPVTTCLVNRGAARIPILARRASLAVWIVPRTSSATRSGTG
jgi:hypothetical protein